MDSLLIVEFVRTDVQLPDAECSELSDLQLAMVGGGIADLINA